MISRREACGASQGTTLAALRWLTIVAFAVVKSECLSRLQQKERFLSKFSCRLRRAHLATGASGSAFSLDLISGSLKPLQELPLVREALMRAGSPWSGIVAGVVPTAVVRSGSITTGACDPARLAGHAGGDWGDTNRHRGEHWNDFDCLDRESQHGKDRAQDDAR